MKKAIIALIKRLYLIRRIDSLLCSISFVIAAIMACQEICPGLNQKKWLVIFPVLYLFSEALLLFLYQKIKSMIKKNEIDYFKINRNRPIIPKSGMEGKIIVGNLTTFFSFLPNFTELRKLVVYKLIGLLISVLIIASISFSDLGLISLILVIFAGFFMAIKMETDEPEKELSL